VFWNCWPYINTKLLLYQMLAPSSTICMNKMLSNSLRNISCKLCAIPPNLTPLHFYNNNYTVGSLGAWVSVNVYDCVSQFSLLSILCATLIAVHGSNIITNATQLSAPKPHPLRTPRGEHMCGGVGCVCNLALCGIQEKGRWKKLWCHPAHPKVKKKQQGVGVCRWGG